MHVTGGENELQAGQLRLGAALAIAGIALHAFHSVVLEAAVPVAVAMAILLAAALATRVKAAIHTTLLLALLVAWTAFVGEKGWRLAVLLPLLAYALIVLASRPLRRSTTWIRRGHLDRGTISFMLAAVAISAVGLLSWFLLAQPDTEKLRQLLPIPSLGILGFVGVGLAFSLLNALLEESAWRGVIQESLVVTVGNPRWVVLLQGLSFGIAHYNGFPQGISGIVLASIYGLMLGHLRMRSDGILAPFLTHIFADGIIFTIMVIWVY